MDRPLPTSTCLLCILAVSLLLVSASAPAAVDQRKATVFYEDALSHFNRGGYPETVIQLRNALQQDPGNLPARILLGRTLLIEDQVDAAVTELEKALSMGGDENLILIPLAQSYLELLKPEQVLTGIVAEGHEPKVDGELLLIQAQAYLMLGNTKLAEEAYLSAGVLMPTDSRALIGRANIALAKGKRSTVDKLVNEATQLAPDDFDVWIYKALLHRDSKQFDQALPAFERALSLRPTSGRALTARAAMWIDVGRIAEAEQDLQQATDLDVGTLETIYLRTLLKFRQGKADEARQLLRESADKIRGISDNAREKLPHVALMLGIVAYFDENHSVAVERFNEFLARFPSHSGAKRYLASTYLALGEWDAVIKLYRPRPTAEPPNDPTSLSMMAEAYRAKGDFKAAQRYYEAAIRLAPSAVGLAVRLALSRLDAGKAEQAVKDLNWLVETFPDLLEAKIQLAQVYTRIGRIDDAKLQIAPLLESQRDNAHFLTVAGAVYMAADELDLARKYTQRAADIDPELILPQLNLARIAQKQELLASAESYFRAILQTHPNHARAAIELSRLQLQQGEFEDALELATLVVENEPDSFEAAVLQLEIQMRAGAEIESIRSTAYTLMQKFPKQPEVDLIVGQMHLQLGEWADAKKAFRHAGEKAKFETEMLLQVAKFQTRLLDLSGALWSLTKALQGSPNHLESGTLKATVLTDLGDYVQAKELLAALVEVHGEQRSLVAAEGHLHMAEGRFDEGIAAFVKAHAMEATRDSVTTLYRAYRTAARTDEGLQLLKAWVRRHPDDIGSRHTLGQGLVSDGRYEEARVVYEDMRANGTEDIVVLNNLAVTYQRLGDKRALAVAKLAYERAPEASSVLDTYGWILTENGSPDEGLPLLREAFARSSTGPEIRFHTGLALMKLGKNADAAEELEAAIRSGDVFADLSRAEKLLAKLKGNK